jgi:ribosomal protein L9
MVSVLSPKFLPRLQLFAYAVIFAGIFYVSNHDHCIDLRISSSRSVLLDETGEDLFSIGRQTTHIKLDPQQHEQQQQISHRPTMRTTSVRPFPSMWLVVTCLAGVMSVGGYCEALHIPAVPTVQQPSAATATTTTRPTSTRLFGKKKAAAASNTSSSSAATGSSSSSSKVQVRLLQNVEGTGRAGDVLLVTPAFYNNKLRPSRLAMAVTDEQVRSMKEEQEEKLRRTARLVSKIRSTLEGHTLTLADNKTGPDGHKLFGGIGPKKVLTSLMETVPDLWRSQQGNEEDDDENDDEDDDVDEQAIMEYLQTNKQVKIVQIAEHRDDGAVLVVKGDIKQTGTYIVTLQLHRSESDVRKRGKGGTDDRDGISTTVDIKVVVE